MHTGKSYKLGEFLVWTRRSIFWLFIIGTVPTILYEVLGFKWLDIPWTVIALLGTATAFIVGFKNVQTYNRTWEARQVWGACISASRSWGMMCRDYLNNREHAKDLIYRHFAWITALRYQLRATREWENMNRIHNQEYKKYYTVPEHEIPLEKELAKYLSSEEMDRISNVQNKAVQLLGMQSAALKKLCDEGVIDAFQFSDMHKVMRDFSDHQGRCERIKNFPYPRQYASVNSFFVKLFCFLLPFGLLGEFDQLNEEIPGFLHGKMVWLVIPFSMLISWVYTSLEQVGDSTENPFEGSPNDVPVSQMSRAVEIDIREMLGETDLPEAMKPQHHIVV